MMAGWETKPLGEVCTIKPPKAEAKTESSLLHVPVSPAESPEALPEMEADEVPLINEELGMQFSADDRELYMEMIGMFVSGRDEERLKPHCMKGKPGDNGSFM